MGKHAQELYVTNAINTFEGEITTVINSASGAAVTSANSYSDGLASNYDAAGSAAAAQAAAATYTDIAVSNIQVEPVIHPMFIIGGV